MKASRVDGALVQRRRLAAGLSLREVARGTHLTGSSLTRLETTGHLSPATTLADLQRLASVLGIPAADLLREPHMPDGTPPADAADKAPPQSTAADGRTLGVLLAHEPRLVPRDDVAVALGWDLTRLRIGQNALDAALRPAGMRVHQVHGRIAVRPADASQDQPAVALAASRTAATGLNTAQAGLVHRALTGTLTTNTVPQGRLPYLASLVNLGILEHVHRGGAASLQLTPAARYAFDVTDREPGQRSRHGADVG